MGLLSKIFSKFRKKPSDLKGPELPELDLRPGHRGAAFGSLAEPQLEHAHKQTGKFEVSVKEGDDFLHNEQPFYVHSSNVVLFVYYPKERKMLVEYKEQTGKSGGRATYHHGGNTYLYSDVSQTEASQILHAPSKGGAVWDLFRVRGSRTAHKKPYLKIAKSIRDKPFPKKIDVQKLFENLDKDIGS